MKDKARLLLLIEKYLAGEASEEEIEEVDRWYQSFETEPGLPPDALNPPEIKIEKTFLQKPHS